MTPESDTPKCRVENQRRKYEKVFRRIGKFKKYTSDVCSVITNHAVKMANLRDKNDEIAKCLDGFTRVEEFSTTSKLSMAVAAELVATVGDHQDMAVQRVETLVLPNLTSYARICDCIKADVWNAIQAIRREKRKKKFVYTLKRKSDDPKTKSCLSDAQRELERASAETARFCHLSEEQVMKFEHKRLMDLKESLGTFVKIQIAMYAKSLELFSETYKQIQSIDEDGDLEILKASLKIGDGSSSRKKSSSHQLKENKSVHNGTSQKSSSSNMKKNYSGMDAAASNRKSYQNNDEATSSEEDLSMDSEVVRHLEKVLHSDHRNLKYSQQRHEKKPKSRISSPPPLTRDGASGRKIKDAKTKHHSNAHKSIKEVRNSTNHHHNGHRNGGNNGGEKRSKTQQEHEDYSYEEYPPILGKRPSTPPRPITVPISRRNSYEDDFSDIRRNKPFHHDDGRQNKPVVSTNKMLDSYYYSQSEEEKDQRAYLALGQGSRRQNQSTVSGGVAKHVSFCNPSDDSYAHVRRKSTATSSLLKVHGGGGGSGERCMDSKDNLKSNILFCNNQRHVLDKTENIGDTRQKQPFPKYC